MANWFQLFGFLMIKGAFAGSTNFELFPKKLEWKIGGSTRWINIRSSEFLKTYSSQSVIGHSMKNEDVKKKVQTKLAKY